MMDRVVCAAVRLMVGERTIIVCGARHFDRLMRDQLALIGLDGFQHEAEQGFINQFGDFLTREKAFEVAYQAGQIIRRVGGNEKLRLYSENLY